MMLLKQYKEPGAQGEKCQHPLLEFFIGFHDNWPNFITLEFSRSLNLNIVVKSDPKYLVPWVDISTTSRISQKFPLILDQFFFYEVFDITKYENHDIKAILGTWCTFCNRR